MRHIIRYQASPKSHCLSGLLESSRQIPMKKAATFFGGDAKAPAPHLNDINHADAFDDAGLIARTAAAERRTTRPGYHRQNYEQCRTNITHRHARRLRPRL